MALIVYIEDEPDLRIEIADELRQHGYDVVEASDGASGYAEIRRLQPDLVLCDISMPGIDGRDLLARLRADAPELASTPFVFLTALVDRDSLVAGKVLGADDYLTKPVDLGLLLATVRSRLGQVARLHQQYATEFERDRAELLVRLGRESELSFRSAAEVLHHLAVGVVLLDRDANVVFVNRAARLLIDGGDGLGLHAGGLRGAGVRETTMLRDLVTSALAASNATAGDCSATCGDLSLGLPRPSQRRPYQVMASALHAPEHDSARSSGVPALALFITDPESRPRPSPELLTRLFGLTPAESRIVAALAQGYSADEIASEQHISRTTVASHLKSAFRKTGTTRQGELIALVAGRTAALVVTAQS